MIVRAMNMLSMEGRRNLVHFVTEIMNMHSL